ncbi:hypothetical protein [Bacillus sp. UMB0893]|uniref:hypothetical protein n=1 Tax=Bacillus sp. UMB0893 TaxID=2066053 RepID=UPI000C775102|nr:hypothetical protein [Bacillus sp. UMB0893]PLR69082.1 hypothetical protein CYJ36_01060 [Bacillus sp. UMB0893]
MSQSKAKKQRLKLLREGKRNPEESRSPFVFGDMRTRQTKTKKEQLNKQKYKNHFSDERKNGSFYFAS